MTMTLAIKESQKCNERQLLHRETHVYTSVYIIFDTRELFAIFLY